jgi:methionine synthase II (cobalamin-independent)
MKYSPPSGGERREREITQEVIEKRAEEKKAVDIDVLTDSLVGFVDLDLPPVAKKGKRK